MPPKRQNIGRRTNAPKRKREKRQIETEEETTPRNEGNRLHISKSHATESQQHEARNEASRVRIRELRQSLSYSDRNEQRGNSRLRVQMNRLNQLVKLDLVAFQYNSEIEYSLHPVVVVESMNKVCTNCKTLKFKNKEPGMCCLNVKVKLPPFKATLEPLSSLVAGYYNTRKVFLELHTKL
ncbi:hypothetical protein AVEN_196460-1 [Araneus ventricosus]|uniref:Uncharacterized protein n=1 Tax=Araneus ventricosus TaxID=182803 RepID=A0A4Y2AXR6_ARAVE|nr:hypothetical protein AVEN_196460-1 [Araneus ventricosus]